MLLNIFINIIFSIVAIMSSQNNMAKETLSLQNHIVWLCSIFVTQNTPIMHNPDDEPSNWFILFNALQLFQLLRNTWAQAIDIALYVVYGGGCEDKKGEDSLTSTRRINGRHYKKPVNTWRNSGDVLRNRHRQWQFLLSVMEIVMDQHDVTALSKR